MITQSVPNKAPVLRYCNRTGCCPDPGSVVQTRCGNPQMPLQFPIHLCYKRCDGVQTYPAGIIYYRNGRICFGAQRMERRTCIRTGFRTMQKKNGLGLVDLRHSFFCRRIKKNKSLFPIVFILTPRAIDPSHQCSKRSLPLA